MAGHTRPNSSRICLRVGRSTPRLSEVAREVRLEQVPAPLRRSRRSGVYHEAMADAPNFDLARLFYEMASLLEARESRCSASAPTSARPRRWRRSARTWRRWPPAASSPPCPASAATSPPASRSTWPPDASPSWTSSAPRCRPAFLTLLEIRGLGPAHRAGAVPSSRRGLGGAAGGDVPLASDHRRGRHPRQDLPRTSSRASSAGRPARRARSLASGAGGGRAGRRGPARPRRRRAAGDRRLAAPHARDGEGHRPAGDLHRAGARDRDASPRCRRWPR